jgi:hypothetical protein
MITASMRWFILYGLICGIMAETPCMSHFFLPSPRVGTSLGVYRISGTVRSEDIMVSDPANLKVEVGDGETNVFRYWDSEGEDVEFCGRSSPRHVLLDSEMFTFDRASRAIVQNTAIKTFDNSLFNFNHQGVRFEHCSFGYKTKVL